MPQFSTLGLCWLSDRLCGQAAHLPTAHLLQMPTGSDCTRPHVTSWNSPEDGRYALIMNAQMLPDAHAYFAPVLVILGVYHLCCPDIVCPAQPEAQNAYSSFLTWVCADWHRLFYRFGLEWGSAANGFPV